MIWFQMTPTAEMVKLCDVASTFWKKIHLLGSDQVDLDTIISEYSSFVRLPFRKIAPIILPIIITAQKYKLRLPNWYNQKLKRFFSWMLLMYLPTLHLVTFVKKNVKNDIIVRYHDHLTRQFSGFACQAYNRKLFVVPIVFHNLSGYEVISWFGNWVLPVLLLLTTSTIGGWRSSLFLLCWPPLGTVGWNTILTIL